MSMVEEILNASLPAALPHQYYPLNAIIPGYEVNTWSVPALLTVFFGVCTILFVATHYVAKSIQPKLTTGELTTIMWFVLSGSIHVVFEGYYAQNFATLGEKQTLLAQLWKEYAFSDSRYLTSSAVVLFVEGLTAVLWGPGCLLTAWMIVKKHPLRHSMQALVSFGEVYGLIIYFGTAAFDYVMLGLTYTRPEPFYFWFYFVFMNVIWLVVPVILITQSCLVHARAIATVQRLADSKKAR